MSSIINPDMIALAREARGFNQTQLADLAGLSQAHVSKAEAGLVPISLRFLSAVAVAVRMPEHFFRQTDLVLGAGTSELFHRKRQDVPARTLRQIHAKINILRMHVARLLRSVNFPECRIPSLDVDELGGASRAAVAVRAALDVPAGPISNVARIVEDAGGLVVPVRFGSDRVDAVSRWVPGLPPLFFVNDAAPVDRYRLSLAHELGHMVLHRVPEPDMEAQANAFAAEFLMPASEIKSQLYSLTLERLARLKLRWRVSMQALLKRAENLHCISSGAARYLWMNLSKRGYRKREPAELDLSAEPPTMLREFLECYQRDLGYTVEDLATLLAATEEDLLDWYPISATKPGNGKHLRLVGGRENVRREA